MAVDYNSWIGIKRGMVTIIGIVGRNYNSEMMLMGRCDCGIEKSFSYGNFKKWKQLSCGCNRTPKKVSYDYTHPLYKIWLSIRCRCNNPNDTGYHNYGGRGVMICKEWDNSYQKFYDWCIANGWRKGLVIDKDTKGNGMLYSPENCAIITQLKNNQVRRSVKLDLAKADEIRKSNMPYSELSKIYGVNKSSISAVRTNRTWVQ